MPKISVVMPAFNAEKYIAEAIDSVLNQTFVDFEFIILNDCSKDRTEEIILSFNDHRIVYLKNEENLGVAVTLNKGLAAATGEYIARMDADDISLPDRFEKQVAYLDKHKECGICGCNIAFFGEKVDPFLFAYSRKHSQICGDLLFNSPFAHPGVMLRASVLKEHQLHYDCSFEGIEDYHLWYQLLHVSEGYNIQKILLRYRMHANQVTQVYKGKQFEALLRFRRKMLTDCGIAYSEEELDIFSRVCFGLRKLTALEYENFIALGKKITTRMRIGKSRVLWSYAALNYMIQNESGFGHRESVSWMDSAYRLLCCLQRIRGKMK